MNLEQQIIYLGKPFKILGAEQEFIVHPSVFGYLPLNKAALQQSFSSEFHVEDYSLVLDKLALIKEDGKVDSELDEETEQLLCNVLYNGAILIGANLVKEYYIKNKLACFSYQKVYELVFEEGVLITTVDQSKAMLRIRKNLELGLRSLSNSRDLRCIKRFLNSALVGDYKSFFFTKSRIKYLKDMQTEYR